MKKFHLRSIRTIDKEELRDIKLTKKELALRLRATDPVDEEEQYNKLLEKYNKLSEIINRDKEEKKERAKVVIPAVIQVIGNAMIVAIGLTVKAKVENGGGIFNGDSVINKKLEK